MMPRRALAADLDCLQELDESGFDPSWNRNDFQALLADPGWVWLTERSVLPDQPAHQPAPQPVAFAAFRNLAGEAELLRIAVRPAERSHGIGLSLLHHCLAELAAAQVTTVHLEVRQDNLPAIRLYERLGFATVGRRRGYYGAGLDALLMTLDRSVPGL